jgi:hypothetical protein
MFSALKTALTPLGRALGHPHSVGMLTQAELAAGGMGSRLSHMAGQGALYGGLGLLATDLGSPVFRGISNVAQDAAYGLGMNIDAVDTSARTFTKMGRQAYMAQQNQLRKAKARQKKYELLQRRMGQSMARKNYLPICDRSRRHIQRGREGSCFWYRYWFRHCSPQRQLERKHYCEHNPSGHNRHSQQQTDCWFRDWRYSFRPRYDC